MHQRLTSPEGWAQQMAYFYPHWREFASAEVLEPPPPQELETHAEISEPSGSELAESPPPPPKAKKAKRARKAKGELASGRPKKKVRLAIPHN